MALRVTNVVIKLVEARAVLSLSLRSLDFVSSGLAAEPPPPSAASQRGGVRAHWRKAFVELEGPSRRRGLMIYFYDTFYDILL